jgi:PleD family two-component response regulator
MSTPQLLLQYSAAGLDSATPPHIPVLAVSSASCRKTSDRPLTPGFEFIRKPLRLHAFMTALDELAFKRQPTPSRQRSRRGILTMISSSGYFLTARILVVDRPATWRCFSSCWRKRVTHVTTTRTKGSSACTREPFDLILLDLVMPDMDGLKS